MKTFEQKTLEERENSEEILIDLISGIEVTDEVEFTAHGKDSRRYYSADQSFDYLKHLNKEEQGRVERGDMVFIENAIRFAIGQGTIVLDWEYGGENAEL